MITELTLKNFKGFELFELSDMSRITLLGGQNNIGKTALLEAIFLIYDFSNPGLLFRHMGWRGLNYSILDFETLFAPIFNNFEINRTVEILVHQDMYYASLEIQANSSYEAKSVSLDLSSVQAISVQGQTNSVTQASYALSLNYKLTGISDEKVLLVVTQTPGNVNIKFEPAPANNFPAGMRYPVAFLPLRWKVDPQEENIRFGKLDIKRLSPRILDFLKIIEPNLQGISSIILPQGPILHADIVGLSRKIPVSLLGDGMARLLSIILMIATAEKGTVLIDEIDTGMHYSVLPQIWEGISKAAQEFQCQVIATTHSYECLQAAHNGILKAKMETDFRYIRLDRTDATIVPKTYSHKMLGAALNHGWEVR